MTTGSGKRKTVKTWMIEDHAAFRTNLTEIINASGTIRCDRNFSSCEEALECLEAEMEHPEVMLVDIALPGMDGIEGLGRIREIDPTIKCIMLTSSERQKHVVEAIRTGASGYLLKSVAFEQIIRGIKDVMEGGASLDPQMASLVLDAFPKKNTAGNEFDLTEREIEVLQALATGKIIKEIADDLNLSANTVKFHIANTYKKLNVQSQAGAVAKGIRKGII
ncbi:Transcriptional regulatory protein DegU [Pontiella desulfatans]|uniref:Transcriptional regulatory protein DegU n=1 Tax=Pontiella desulfatans TaxID=2750659 RepID=A0A6C2U6W9_PONDE|nr:response regulator transcription factor [Pontiella desulfatans]VGO15675.1 Transcriptional regulatory protein DegU [Pontiella desulfatans]